jgi:hypothetical protein
MIVKKILVEDSTKVRRLYRKVYFDISAIEKYLDKVVTEIPDNSYIGLY